MNDPVSPVIMTLGFVRNGDKVLLGLKKRGFGEGYWNGFGGKLHNGETHEEGMIRELEEECGLIASNPDKVAYLEFKFENGKIIHGHVYLINHFTGNITESDEMRPEWFEITSIPYDLMWEDDRYWLPLVMEGKKITGRFTFTDNNQMLSREIEIVGESHFSAVTS